MCVVFSGLWETVDIAGKLAIAKFSGQTVCLQTNSDRAVRGSYSRPELFLTSAASKVAGIVLSILSLPTLFTSASVS